MRRRPTLQHRTLRVATTVALVAAMVLAQAGLGCAAHTKPAGSLPQPTPAARLSSNHKVLAPTRGIYTGVFKPPAPFSLSALDSYKRIAGKSPAVVMWYQPWVTEAHGEFKTAEIEALLRRGTIPMITWEPWDPGGDPHYLTNPAKQPAYSLSKIVGGDYDPYIRSWARAAKAVNGPIMLRPLHEMNGTWYPWGGTVNGNTPERFRAAWRHIHGIFAEEGVTNVTWVWSINWKSYPDTKKNRYAAFYPGSAYVDWTSISGFNWGKSKKDPKNLSFSKIYTKPLAYLATLKKPIIISEIACNTGVGKPEWIRDAYKRIAANKKIKGVVYFDRHEVGLNRNQNWQLSSTKASEAAYRSAISSTLFLGASSGSILATASATP